ncbi:DUF2683 family protein [Pedobacter endophyticus]|uniref:Uncharacterized protein n=1 Tax=Pedobacter endophyticus TaxID=2789740 RepID=A0A7U3Q589_9SPHI|nr:DUF2683 family protein [Pedobacter endophyticus]QPH38802.1 hypothetical protein IZT61_17265 [Pedobacter endophyticus]
METVTLHPQNREQLNAIKAFAKALKVPFGPSTKAEQTEREKGIDLYGIEMVKTVEEAEQDIKNGNTTRVKREDLKSFLGL